jgi:UDP-glucose 4-epimerase
LKLVRSKQNRDTVLVTGGAGFIGSHLSEALLTRGASVVVLDDMSTGRYRNVRHLLDDPHFKLVEGSVLDLDLVKDVVAGCNAVYHLAAAVGVRLIVDRPLQSLITNIKGTENVLDAAHLHRKKILITSSSEVYGKSSSGPFKEDDDRVLGSTRKLRWSYSTSKAVDEILAFTYHKELGLPTVIARLFNTVGPRQSAQYGMVLPRFIGQALRGDAITIYGDGAQSRVFTYVGDVVEALIRLMDSPAAEGEAFNVAGDREITIADLARLVVARCQSSSTLRYLPFEEVYGDGFEDTPRRAADTNKLEQCIGFKCETTLEDTIELLIRHSGDGVSSAGKGISS